MRRRGKVQVILILSCGMTSYLDACRYCLLHDEESAVHFVDMTLFHANQYKHEERLSYLHERSRPGSLSCSHSNALKMFVLKFHASQKNIITCLILFRLHHRYNKLHVL